MSRLIANAGLQTLTWSVTYAGTDLGDDDVKVLSPLLPAGATVIGFSVVSDALDSDGGEGAVLEQDIAVGDTAVIEGYDAHQTAAARSFLPITPLVLTEKSAVTISQSVAADDGQAGTLILTAYYYAT